MLFQFRKIFFPGIIPGESKKYTRLMSHKGVTIALILEIWLEFDRKSLKLNHDMKNNHFASLLIGLLTLKQSASF